MKRFRMTPWLWSSVILLMTAVIWSGTLLAERNEDTKAAVDPREVEELIAELNRQAELASVLVGTPEQASITCDAFWIVCTCDGVFDCAWLSWFCSALGGVSGFDDECFLPGHVPGGSDLLKDAQALSRKVSKMPLASRR